MFGPIDVSALSATTIGGLTGIVPNPASGDARIDFTAVQAEKVRISVVDVTGREVAVLADGWMTPGIYSMAWDGRRNGSRLPAGIYLVRWRSGGTILHRRLVLTP